MDKRIFFLPRLSRAVGTAKLTGFSWHTQKGREREKETHQVFERIWLFLNVKIVIFDERGRKQDDYNNLRNFFHVSNVSWSSLGTDFVI